MIFPTNKVDDRTTSSVTHTRALPQVPADDSATGRHSEEYLGHAATPVTAYAPVPQHLPSGRRFRGIPGHLARVAYARAVRGQQ